MLSVLSFLVLISISSFDLIYFFKSSEPQMQWISMVKVPFKFLELIERVFFWISYFCLQGVHTFSWQKVSKFKHITVKESFLVLFCVRIRTSYFKIIIQGLFIFPIIYTLIKVWMICLTSLFFLTDVILNVLNKVTCSL